MFTNQNNQAIESAVLPVVELMEDRRLLSASATVVDGTLTVSGTSRDDSVVFFLNYDGSRVKVNVNGQVYAFDAEDVERLRCSVKGGDDFVKVSDKNGALELRLKVHGGLDDDTLVGGSLNDRLFGDEDDDVLKGRGGLDQLFGEEGMDWLDGGLGDDLILGGIGDDFESDLDDLLDDLDEYDDDDGLIEDDDLDGLDDLLDEIDIDIDIDFDDVDVLIEL